MKNKMKWKWNEKNEKNEKVTRNSVREQYANIHSLHMHNIVQQKKG